MRAYAELMKERRDCMSWDYAAECQLADEGWLIFPASRNRDSSCLDESNFRVALREMGGEGEDVQVHRFGHWACGWYELIIVRPGTPAAETAAKLAGSLEDYPILDEFDYDEECTRVADETWRNCYTQSDRIDMMRNHLDLSESLTWRDLLAAARGKFFPGDDHTGFAEGC